MKPTTFRKLFSRKRRSCTRHGPYEGAYCPACFEKAIGAVPKSTDE